MSIREIWQANGPVFSAGSERADEPEWWTCRNEWKFSPVFPCPKIDNPFWKPVPRSLTSWPLFKLRLASPILSATHHRLLFFWTHFLFYFDAIAFFLSKFLWMAVRVFFFFLPLLLGTSHPGVRSVTVSHDLLLDSTSNRERSKLSRELLLFCPPFLYFFFIPPSPSTSRRKYRRALLEKINKYRGIENEGEKKNHNNNNKTARTSEQADAYRSVVMHSNLLLDAFVVLVFFLLCFIIFFSFSLIVYADSDKIAASTDGG